MKIVFNFIDKVLFAVAALIGLQVPAFIQQYSQRLGGHLDEAIAHLDKYQLLAQKHYNGDLNALVSNFLTSNNQKLIDVGQIVDGLMKRVEHLHLGVDGLQANGLWSKVLYLVQNLDQNIAHATVDNYQWNVPLTLDALVCALIFALFVTLLFNAVQLMFAGIVGLISGPRHGTFDDEDEEEKPSRKNRLARKEEPSLAELG